MLPPPLCCRARPPRAFRCAPMARMACRRLKRQLGQGHAREGQGPGGQGQGHEGEALVQGPRGRLSGADGGRSCDWLNRSRGNRVASSSAGQVLMFVRRPSSLELACSRGGVTRTRSGLSRSSHEGAESAKQCWRTRTRHLACDSARAGLWGSVPRRPPHRGCILVKNGANRTDPREGREGPMKQPSDNDHIRRMRGAGRELRQLQEH